MMLSDLPCDLVDEILVRVPTKSLIRLRSTCKRWKSLFSDPTFAKKQLDNAIKQNMGILFSDKKTIVIGLRKLDDRYNVNLCDLGLKHRSTVVLHCDGLLLLFTEKSELMVWNPCLKQTKLINNNYDNCSPDFAFGCDKKSGGGRYKILAFLQYSQTHDDSCKKYQNVEMYDFTSNSWRVLYAKLDFLLESPAASVSLKGNSYWVAADENTGEGFIVRFDYSTEMFGRISSLPFLAYPSKEHLSILVKNDRIFVLHQRTPTDIVEIWMTGPVIDGQRVSWSRLMIVDENKFGTRFVHPYFFVHDEENKVIVLSDIISVISSVHRVCVIKEDRYTATNVENRNTFTRIVLHNYVHNYEPSLVHIP